MAEYDPNQSPPSDEPAPGELTTAPPAHPALPAPPAGQPYSAADPDTMRQMLDELRLAREERAKQAGQIEALQRQLEAQARGEVVPTGPFTAPAWVNKDHEDALVAYMIRHGDQPRGAEIAMGEAGPWLMLGIRNVYVRNEAGQIGALPVQWADLQA